MRTNGLPDDIRSELELADRNGKVSNAPSWPELNHKALYGLPGKIVRAILPHTEADKVALLASLLAATGNALSRKPVEVSCLGYPQPR